MMLTRTEEDFDLELRSLPGVINVGIDRLEGGDIEAVTLVVANDDPATVRADAVQIASLYFPEVEVRVERASGELASAVSPTRVALVRADYDSTRGSARSTSRTTDASGSVGRAAACSSAGPRRPSTRCATSATTSPSPSSTSTTCPTARITRSS